VIKSCQKFQFIRCRLGKGNRRKGVGNGNSESPRGREGMKIDRLRMKEKEFWNKLRIFLK
jgi:hypothetical protein